MQHKLKSHNSSATGPKTAIGTGNSFSRLTVAGGVFDLFVASVCTTYVAKNFGEARSLITPIAADEGVPHNLVTAMAADEGVPHDLVRA